MCDKSVSGALVDVVPTDMDTLQNTFGAAVKTRRLVNLTHNKRVSV